MRNEGEGHDEKDEDHDIHGCIEAEDLVRAHFQGTGGGSLGPLDDEGRSRIVVGPRRIHHVVRNMKEWEVLRELRRRSPLAFGRPDPTIPTKKLLREFDWLRRLRNNAVHEVAPQLRLMPIA